MTNEIDIEEINDLVTVNVTETIDVITVDIVEIVETITANIEEVNDVITVDITEVVETITVNIVQMGPSLELSNLIKENFSSQVGNGNKEFYTANVFVVGTPMITINGLKQILDMDYSETPALKKITFTDAPLDVGFVDLIEIIYQPQS
jgi:hypothetical protein